MIKIDIEMPIYCFDCPCHNGENGRCQISGNFTPDKRPFDCPLTEEDVDFAPVIHAKWIDGYTHEHLKVNSKGFVCAGIFGCNCSNCGGYVTASDEYAAHGSYCPNCGADMRGENDE